VGGGGGWCGRRRGGEEEEEEEGEESANREPTVRQGRRGGWARAARKPSQGLKGSKLP
jgi:hypothetical protein